MTSRHTPARPLVGRVRRRCAPMVPLLAVALVAIACKPGPYKIGQNDINPVPRGSVPVGGTLNWPISNFPANYNLHDVDGATPDVGVIVGALMPALFTFDAAGKPVINHDYLVSASLSTSSSATPTATTSGTAAPTGTAAPAPVAGQQVVTYEIDPRASWSDGTPITAADFIAQWKALNGTDKTYQSAASGGYGEVTSVVQGSNPREVQVTFPRPFTDWQSLFTPLYPASLNSNADSFNQGWITGTATSAGPFSFQGFDANAETVTVVRNKAWWGSQAKLDSIVFHVLGADPSRQLDSLARGLIDFVGIQADPSQLSKGQAIKDVAVRRAGDPGYRQLTLNGTSPTLSDPKVRNAIALAVDRARIATVLLGPLGVPATVLNNHIFMTNQDGYQANAGQFANPDPAKAAALLDEAGWKLDKGVRSRNKQPLEIRLVIPDDSTAAVQEATLIKGMLSSVGITLTIQTVSADSFLSTYVAQGDYDLALFSWEGTALPISTAQSIYQNPTTLPSGRVNYHANYARLGSPQIDALFAQAAGELDHTRYLALGNQIDTLIWQEVHSLTLYQRPQIVVAKSQLANFGAFGFATPKYEDIGFTKS